MRFLALGDSYTIGESVDEEERWPVQLSTLLRKAGVPLDDPTIIAKTGWTTDELMEGMKKAAPESNYDLVSLLIGVNNQYRARSVVEFREEFTALLDTAIALARGDTNRVIVLSIPDWGVMPFAKGRNRKEIANEIDAYNVVKQEETLKRAVHFFDITDLSRRVKDDSALVASDGLHPSGKMYAAWVARISATVKSLLAK